MPRTQRNSRKQVDTHRPSRGLRCIALERLEERYAFSVEGSTFAIDQTLDTTGLLGTVSANAQWGDGTQSALTVSNQTPVGSLRARIDYSLDTRGFFSIPERRQLLQAAADSLISKFSDSLSAIQPSGTNTWKARIRNPVTAATTEFTNLTIAANEILIFAGSRDLPGNQLGEGGAGGISSSGSQDWVNLVKSRGQAGALAATPTDFGPWGGYIAFDDLATWHFGTDTTGLDAGESDFYSVAIHELTHSLGFGTAPSWSRFVQGSTFIGPKSMAAYDAGGAVPLTSELSHWQNGLTDGGQETLMDPSIATGSRKLLTGLDLAGLGDVGWQIIAPSVRVTGTHVYGDNGTFPVRIDLRGSQIGLVSHALSETVTNAAPTLETRSNVRISLGTPLSVIDLGRFTDPGFDLPNATPARTERFTFSIAWGDGTANSTGNATIDQMGSPGNLTRGSFDGTHTYAAIGTYTVRYTVTDDDGGTASQSFIVEVTAPPSLTLVLDKTVIAENAGTNAATLRVQRTGFDTTLPMIVTLTSSDTSEVRLPPSVTILAGGTEAIVGIEAIDDALLDGTIVVSLSASSGSTSATPVSIQVADFETIQMVLGTASIAENAGTRATRLTVTRSNTDIAAPLTIQLASSDTSEATLPGSVTIPSGAASTTIDVAAIDDTLIDGSQAVQLSASASGYVAASVGIVVTDHELINVTLDRTQLTESSANRSAQAQVTIPGVAPAGGIQIAIQSTPSNQLIVPATITIPAGSRSASFEVQAKNDFLVEGNHTAQLSLSANGLIPAAVDIAIIDDDLPLWQNPSQRFDVNDDGAISPLDALLIINSLNLLGARELIPGIEAPRPFIDPTGDGAIQPVDALVIINFLNLRGS